MHTLSETAQRQVAQRQGLVVRRVRALHELGTIGMLRGHQLDYLEQASQLALEAGALSTAAVVNLQLGAVYVYGFEHEAALTCARRSADIAAQLGLGLTQAVATAMQATAHALAGRREQMERSVAEAFALASGHPDVAGQVWGNARGLGSLLQEERASALAALDEAVNFLRDPRCTVPGGIIGSLWACCTLSSMRTRPGRARRSARLAPRPFQSPKRCLGMPTLWPWAGQPNPLRQRHVSRKLAACFAGISTWACGRSACVWRPRLQSTMGGASRWRGSGKPCRSSTSAATTLLPQPAAGC